MNIRCELRPLSNDLKREIIIPFDDFPFFDFSIYEILKKEMSSGVFDKNCVEIYEGDTVSSPSGTVNMNSDGTHTQNPPRLYKIYFSGFAFTVGNDENHSCCGVLNYNVSTKGNILEVISKGLVINTATPLTSNPEKNPKSNGKCIQSLL